MKKLTLAALLLLGCSDLQAAPPQVSNPKLATAIQTFLASGKVDDKRRMFTALNQATYLIPQQPIPQESRYSPISVRLPGGGNCVLVFSSNAEVRAAGIGELPLLDTPAENLWRMLDEQPIQCLLLDSGGKSMQLNREVVAVIRRQ